MRWGVGAEGVVVMSWSESSGVDVHHYDVVQRVGVPDPIMRM